MQKIYTKCTTCKCCYYMFLLHVNSMQKIYKIKYISLEFSNEKTIFILVSFFKLFFIKICTSNCNLLLIKNYTYVYNIQFNYFLCIYFIQYNYYFIQ